MYSAIRVCPLRSQAEYNFATPRVFRVQYNCDYISRGTGNGKVEGFNAKVKQVLSDTRVRESHVHIYVYIVGDNNASRKMRNRARKQHVLLHSVHDVHSNALDAHIFAFRSFISPPSLTNKPVRSSYSTVKLS